MMMMMLASGGGPTLAEDHFDRECSSISVPRSKNKMTEAAAKEKQEEETKGQKEAGRNFRRGVHAIS